MKNKAFKLGIIVGRFQTFHTGHLDMIEKACAVCDRVGIFVGCQGRKQGSDAAAVR